ncbi:MAG: efflux RND transporter periplasmic adaptor subunit [bacterium]
MPNRKPLIALLVFVAVLVVLKLTVFAGPKKSPMGSAGKGGPPRALRVGALVVAGRPLEQEVRGVGTLLANEEAVLHPEIAGKVQSIAFAEGARVEKGALLVKLVDADYRAQLAKLESVLKLNRENAERQKRLLAINGVSQQQVDEAVNQVVATESDLDYTRALIAKTEIRAPFSGVVGLRQVSVGSTVDRADVIVSVQQLDPMKLDFSLPEKYAPLVRVGAPVTFTVEGVAGEQRAVVYAVEPKIDADTRTVRIRARATNSNRRLFPGAFARVQYGLSRDRDAILLPTDAVVPVLKGKKVFVVRGGLAISQPITIGVRTEREVEVLTGLQPGDTVITTGLLQVRDSVRVDVKVGG